LAIQKQKGSNGMVLEKKKADSATGAVKPAKKKRAWELTRKEEEIVYHREHN